MNLGDVIALAELLIWLGYFVYTHTDPKDLITLLLGALIALVVSWVFYGKAAKDLQVETARVREFINILARHLQAEGVIKADWDEHGNLKNYTDHFYPSSIPSTGVVGKPEFIRKDPPPQPGSEASQRASKEDSRG